MRVIPNSLKEPMCEHFDLATAELSFASFDKFCPTFSSVGKFCLPFAVWEGFACVGRFCKCGKVLQVLACFCFFCCNLVLPIRALFKLSPYCLHTRSSTTQLGRGLDRCLSHPPNSDQIVEVGQPEISLIYINGKLRGMT